MTKRNLILGVACFVLCALVLSIPADAVEKNDWIIRGRFIHVSANDTSDAFAVDPAGHLGVENNTAFELDVVWAITPHWGLEMSVSDVNLDLEGRGTWESTDDLGSFNILPVTLTAHYRFLPNRLASPYIGFGINYTHVHDVESNIPLVEGAGETDINMTDSWGWAGQVGVDLFFSEHWSVNFEVRYLDIDTDTEFETDGVAWAATNLHIEPWVSSVGVGFRF